MPTFKIITEIFFMELSITIPTQNFATLMYFSTNGKRMKKYVHVYFYFCEMSLRTLRSCYILRKKMGSSFVAQNGTYTRFVAQRSHVNPANSVLRLTFRFGKSFRGCY